MRGRIQATGIAGLFGALSWIFPPLSYVSGAVIGLVGLRLGPREGVIVIAGAAGLCGIMALTSSMSPMPTVALVIALWLPIWLCALVLRMAHSQGAMLVTVGLLAAMFATSMRLVIGDVEAWWRAWLEGLLEQARIQDELVPSPAMLEHSAAMMNGLMAAAISISLTVTMLLARWWQALLYNPGGFATEFQELSLPRQLAMSVVFITVFVSIQFAVDSAYGLMTDLLLIAITLYLFQGLAIAHHYHRTHNQSIGWLVVLYVVLLVVPHYACLALAVIGLTDSFVNFRGLKRPSHSP
jgi:hypothetical protein